MGLTGAALALCLQAGAQDAERTGLLVPLYTRPGRTWDALVRARQAHPEVPIVAIVNRSNGPGRTVDPKFAAKIVELQVAGVRAIGYVRTDYAKRPADEAKADIDRWRDGYKVDGIFFDEMKGETGGEAYYAALDIHAKSKGASFTVGNPGRDVPATYAETMDMLVISERAGLPKFAPSDGCRAKRGVLAHGVAALDADAVREVARSAGWLYVTDAKLPNPWNSLPSYFQDLLKALDEPVR